MAVQAGLAASIEHIEQVLVDLGMLAPGQATDADGNPSAAFTAAVDTAMIFFRGFLEIEGDEPYTPDLGREILDALNTDDEEVIEKIEDLIRRSEQHPNLDLSKDYDLGWVEAALDEVASDGEEAFGDGLQDAFREAGISEELWGSFRVGGLPYAIRNSTKIFEDLNLIYAPEEVVAQAEVTQDEVTQVDIAQDEIGQAKEAILQTIGLDPANNDWGAQATQDKLQSYIAGLQQQYQWSDQNGVYTAEFAAHLETKAAALATSDQTEKDTLTAFVQNMVLLEEKGVYKPPAIEQEMTVETASEYTEKALGLVGILANQKLNEVKQEIEGSGSGGDNALPDGLDGALGELLKGGVSLIPENVPLPEEPDGTFDPKSQESLQALMMLFRSPLTKQFTGIEFKDVDGIPHWQYTPEIGEQLQAQFPKLIENLIPDEAQRQKLLLAIDGEEGVKEFINSLNFLHEKGQLATSQVYVPTTSMPVAIVEFALGEIGEKVNAKLEGAREQMDGGLGGLLGGEDGLLEGLGGDGEGFLDGILEAVGGFLSGMIPEIPENMPLPDSPGGTLDAQSQESLQALLMILRSPLATRFAGIKFEGVDHIPHWKWTPEIGAQLEPQIPKLLEKLIPDEAERKEVLAGINAVGGIEVFIDSLNFLEADGQLLDRQLYLPPPPPIADIEKDVLLWALEKLAPPAPADPDAQDDLSAPGPLLVLVDEMMRSWTGGYGFNDVLPDDPRMVGLKEKNAETTGTNEQRLQQFFAEAMREETDLDAAKQKILNGLAGVAILPYGDENRRVAFRKAGEKALDDALFILQAVERNPTDYEIRLSRAAKAFADSFTEGVSNIAGPEYDDTPEITHDPRMLGFAFRDSTGVHDYGDIYELYSKMNEGRAPWEHKLLVFKDGEGHTYVAGVQDSRIFTVMEVDVEALRSDIAELRKFRVTEDMVPSEADAVYRQVAEMRTAIEEKHPAFAMAMEGQGLFTYRARVYELLSELPEDVQASVITPENSRPPTWRAAATVLGHASEFSKRAAQVDADIEKQENYLEAQRAAEAEAAATSAAETPQATPEFSQASELPGRAAVPGTEGDGFNADRFEQAYLADIDAGMRDQAVKGAPLVWKEGDQTFVTYFDPKSRTVMRGINITAELESYEQQRAAGVFPYRPRGEFESDTAFLARERPRQDAVELHPHLKAMTVQYQRARTYSVDPFDAMVRDIYAKGDEPAGKAPIQETYNYLSNPGEIRELTPTEKLIQTAQFPFQDPDNYKPVSRWVKDGIRSIFGGDSEPPPMRQSFNECVMTRDQMLRDNGEDITARHGSAESRWECSTQAFERDIVDPAKDLTS